MRTYLEFRNYVRGRGRERVFLFLSFWVSVISFRVRWLLGLSTSRFFVGFEVSAIRCVVAKEGERHERRGSDQ
jgi:gamma-glutamylcysteine synthetase